MEKFIFYEGPPTANGEPGYIKSPSGFWDIFPAINNKGFSQTEKQDGTRTVFRRN